MASPISKINTLWQTIGGSILAPVLIVLLTIDSLVYGYLTGYALLLWLNVAFLFFHEFEEYILNPNGIKHFFNHYSAFAKRPHKANKPLSEGLIFTINSIAWIWAILSALFATTLPWLGISFLIANLLINCSTHIISFELSHKSYNPGLATVVFLFIPLYTVIFWYTIEYNTLSQADWGIAFIAGIAATLLLTAALRVKTSAR